MSKLADILKNEYKSKGIVTGAASAVGKKALEKLDIRNALFGGSGIGSIIGQKLFGKGYSATSAKNLSANQTPITASAPAIDNTLLQSLNQNAAISAKNSMSIPMMSRDMNVMRQNIVKLVKLQGGTPSTKADMFFSKAKEREAQYENAMEKSKPTKIGEKPKDDEKEKKGFVGKLLEYGTILFVGLKSILSKIPDMLSSVVSGALKTITEIFSIDNIMKVVGIAKDTLSGIFRIAGMIATNPVFLALAGIASAAAILAYMRGDYDAEKNRYLELAKKKKEQGALSDEEEAELKRINRPNFQQESRKTLGGYDPITNKIEDANASVTKIVTETKADKSSQTAPKMNPGTASEMLKAGPEVYTTEGYTKEQLEHWSKGKNAPVKEPVTSAPVITSPNAPTSLAQQIGGAPTSLAQQIGGSESGGNYNVSFGDRKLKNGTWTDTAKEKTGKSLTDMTLEEVYAYQKTRGANGAVGKYQFMNSTLTGLAQQAGLDPKTTKFTPEVQDKLNEKLISQNENSLKKMGIPTTPGNMYMSHYIGAGGTKAVHEAIAKDPNMSVADAMSAKGYKIGNNPELYKLKVGEFESTLAGRLKRNENPHATELANAPSNKGTALTQASNDVTSTRDSALAKKPETVVVQAPAQQAANKQNSGVPIAFADTSDSEFIKVMSRTFIM